MNALIPQGTEDGYVYRQLDPGDEPQVLSVLQRCLDGWRHRDGVWWRWMTRTRPGFAPSDVVVVQHDEQIVGCFHAAVHPIRLGPGVEVLASIDTAFAILPEHRGQGLPARAHAMMDADLLDRGVALRGGFPLTPALNAGFYRPRFGYVLTPVDTVVYRKIVGVGALGRVARRFDGVAGGPRVAAVLRSRPLVVNVHLDTLPPCRVVVAPGKVVVAPGWSEAATLQLRLPYRLLALHASGARLRAGVAAAAALVRGRLRLRGLVGGLPLLLRLAAAVALDRRAPSAAAASEPARRPGGPDGEVPR